MVNFPTQDYRMSGSLAENANIGMSPLNALWQGRQQADIEQMRQKALVDAQEMIRQRQLENVGREREAAQAQLEMQMPGFLEQMARGKAGTAQTQEMAGLTAQQLQPIKQEVAQAEQSNLLAGFKQRRYLADLDRVINAGYDEKTGVELNPQQIEALKKVRNDLAISIATTPEQIGKEELAILKGQQGANKGIPAGIRIKMGAGIPLTLDEANYLGDESLAGKTLEKPMASTDVARAQRMLQGANAAIARMGTIMKFREGTDVGMMPNLGTKDGLVNAMRNFAGKTVMPSEAKMMNTIFQGLGRDLAAVEAGGLATGLAELAKKLESGVYINPGEDDAATVAMKLADVHQVIVEHLEPSIGVTLRGEQGKSAQKIVDRVKTVIPYTPDDVIEAYNKVGGGGKTIGERSKEVVGQQVKQITSDAEYNALPSGTVFIGPDGKRRRKP